MAITETTEFHQIVIGVANSNSSQPVGDTITKVVQSVDICKNDVTGKESVSVADPLETDWDISPWVTLGLLDFLPNYDLAKIVAALGTDRNGRAARVATALEDTVLLPNVALTNLSALLDAEKTRRGI